MLTLQQARDLLRVDTGRFEDKRIGKLVWIARERARLKQVAQHPDTTPKLKTDINRCLHLHAICIKRMKFKRTRHADHCRGCKCPMVQVKNTVNSFYCMKCVLDRKADTLEAAANGVLLCVQCKLQPATHGYTQNTRCKECATFSMLQRECTERVPVPLLGSVVVPK